MARRESTLCGCSFPVIENFVFERSSGCIPLQLLWTLGMHFNDFNIHFGFPIHKGSY